MNERSWIQPNRVRRPAPLCWSRRPLYPLSTRPWTKYIKGLTTSSHHKSRSAARFWLHRAAFQIFQSEFRNGLIQNGSPRRLCRDPGSGSHCRGRWGRCGSWGIGHWPKFIFMCARRSNNYLTLILLGFDRARAAKPARKTKIVPSFVLCAMKTRKRVRKSRPSMTRLNEFTSWQISTQRLKEFNNWIEMYFLANKSILWLETSWNCPEC